ncbi:hypothetical protein WG66_009432, partial [Moniliophthora roreri]
TTFVSSVVSDKTAITGNLAAPRCTLLLHPSAPLPAPSLSLRIPRVPRGPAAASTTFQTSSSHIGGSRCHQRPTVVVVAVAIGISRHRCYQRALESSSSCLLSQ